MSPDETKTNVLRRSHSAIGERTGPEDGGGSSSHVTARPSRLSVSGARSLPNLKRPAVSRQFGRYELLLELAAGGMATLYLARLRGPEGFEKLVALKIIHDHLTREPSFVRMFFDEARISAMVHHPNVVQVLDLGQIEDTYYIAMEYVHGKDYRAVLKGTYHWTKQEKPPLSSVPSWLLSARVAADAAAGLHAAHELVSAQGEPLGLVHRDVSPHNILLSYDGHVKLTDFGIAYAKHRMTHTDSGVLKGKLAYMSPEQAEGTAIDRRADVFALGIVLWESVCQRRLFRRETDTATLYALTHGDIPRPSSVRDDLPSELEQIVLRCLAKRPGVRYQTAQEVARSLEQLIARHDDVIGAAELSQVMTNLFTEQRAKLDEEIAEAMAEADAEANAREASDGLPQPERTDARPAELPKATGHPEDGVGVSETRLSAQALRSVPPTPRRTLPLTVAVIALTFLLAAGLSWYLLSGGRAEPPSPRQGAAAAPPTLAPPPEPPRPRERPRPRPAVPTMRPTAGKLVLSFVVKPSRAKATIRFRGKRYRQNRVDLLVTAGQTTERVRVEAPGYHTVERVITVRPEATLKHEVILKPRRRRYIGRTGMGMGNEVEDIGFE